MVLGLVLKVILEIEYNRIIVLILFFWSHPNFGCFKDGWFYYLIEFINHNLVRWSTQGIQTSQEGSTSKKIQHKTTKPGEINLNPSTQYMFVRWWPSMVMTRWLRIWSTHKFILFNRFKKGRGIYGVIYFPLVVLSKEVFK